ncbi:MAG: YybH family protein [Planctomycetia bacterium]
MSATTELAALVCALAAGACHTVPHAREARAREQILGVIRAQAEAWNRGDVETFMREGYWDSPQLVFLSGGDDTRGFQPALERYIQRYQRGDAKMGRLTFDRLEVELLGEDAALARGRWHLDYDDLPDPEGLFTLVLRRFSGPQAHWRIIHDHTSLKTP